MPKVKDMDGKPFLWRVWCPGCEEHHGLDARWTFNGDYDRPTFSPSLVVGASMGQTCHSFIRDGHIQFLTDSAHKLAGQTVELPELEV